MKYLVTDDSKLARLSLIKSLKAHISDEVEIFQATNGEEAISIMQDKKIDIVFLDLTMPVMDGYTALPKLLEINPQAKIIVISADVQQKAQDMVLNLGAKMHIQKPINVNKMKTILGTLSR